MFFVFVNSFIITCSCVQIIVIMFKNRLLDMSILDLFQKKEVN